MPPDDPSTRDDELPSLPGPLAPGVVQADDATSRRLRRAAIDVVAERGYAETTVRDLLPLAGIASQAYYARYASKQACVLAAADEAAVAHLSACAHAAREAGPDGALAALIAATLQAAAERPAVAQLLALEIHAAGAEGVALAERARTAYAGLVADALGGDDGALTLEAGRMVTGAVEQIVLSRLLAGHASELPALAESLTAWAASYRELLARPEAATSPELTVEPLRRRGQAPGSLVAPGPGGRRTLSPGRRPDGRAEVEASQRDRILDAVATLVADGGYAALNRRALVETAEISARTIYERFASVDDAFDAALRSGARGALAAVLPELMARPDRAQGVYAALVALTRFLAEEPAYARMALVDAPAAGRRAGALQDQAILSVAAVLEGHVRPTPAPLTAEATAAGMWALCAGKVSAGQVGALPRAAPALAWLALTPLVGAEQAIAAVRQAQAQPDAPGSPAPSPG